MKPGGPQRKNSWSSKGSSAFNRSIAPALSSGTTCMRIDPLARCASARNSAPKARKFSLRAT
jgi:hypothetical protein